MSWRVPLSDLDYGEEERQAVLQVLDSRWLTMGAVTQRFESEFATLVGCKHALAVSNATVALHLACLALGIGPGDEVIAPSLTFVATSNAVLYTGAQVRFSEVTGAHDLNIDPADIERLITPRTRAVIVVHYAGYPCQMQAILSIAHRHNLAVIEDAAHAPGARLGGRSLGAWGDVGCFSFFSNKNLATGEGGMLTTDRDDLADKLRVLRSHGMTSLTWDRHQGHAYSYDVVGLGYNYRMDELRAALGVAQLQKLALNNARRGQLTRAYWEALDGWLEMPFQQLAAQPGVEPVYHIFPALLPPGVDRKAFMDYLRSQGIQTSIHYPPIHTFSYYRELYPNLSLPRTEALAAREITLPLYPTMSPADLEAVAAAVRQALH